MTDAANSALIHLALAATPVPAINYEYAPRVELLRAGLVHMVGRHLALTLDGLQEVLPMLREMMGEVRP